MGKHEIKTLDVVANNYVRGIDENVEKYREHAEESVNTYIKHFTPFYVKQLAAKLAILSLPKGYTRLAAYGLLMDKYGKEATKELQDMLLKEMAEKGIKPTAKAITPDKIKKAVELVVVH